jgi:hypothetical protein
LRGPTVETRCVGFCIQRALEKRCVLRSELAELILQLNNNAPMFMPAIAVARSLGVGSMLGGGLAQFVKDCAVIRVDGIAADAARERAWPLSGGVNHCVEGVQAPHGDARRCERGALPAGRDQIAS